MSRTLRILLQWRKSPSQPPPTVCCLRSLDPGAHAGHLPAPSLRAPARSDASDSSMSHHMASLLVLWGIILSGASWMHDLRINMALDELWALVVCQSPCVLLPSCARLHISLQGNCLGSAVRPAVRAKSSRARPLPDSSKGREAGGRHPARGQPMTDYKQDALSSWPCHDLQAAPQPHCKACSPSMSRSGFAASLRAALSRCAGSGPSPQPWAGASGASWTCSSRLSRPATPRRMQLLACGGSPRRSCRGVAHGMERPPAAPWSSLHQQPRLPGPCIHMRGRYAQEQAPSSHHRGLCRRMCCRRARTACFLPPLCSRWAGMHHTAFRSAV